MSAAWRMGLLSVLLLAAPRVAAAQSSGMAIDWNAVLRALGNAMNSWRISSPSVDPTDTPVPTATSTPQPTQTQVPGTRTRTATRVGTSTRTPVPSRTGTSTRLPTGTRTETRIRTATRTVSPTWTRAPSRTGTATRAPTQSRTPTLTRPPTNTRTLVPTATPTPTIDPNSATGQIDLVDAGGVPPAQRLASALLIFPYVVVQGDTDTRIELMNMSDQEVELNCFYVRQSDCVEVGFYVRLTAQQPLAWLASEGANNTLTFTAVPPFDGVGELKCAVVPDRPDLRYHNVLQGRALVYDTGGETVGYGAIGFQRLIPGGFSGAVDLDGFTYEECPDRLHFQVFTRSSGSSSTLVLVPCEEDLLNQVPTESTVQLAIVNEFEQVFSSSFRFSCHTTKSFSSISTLGSTALGTLTAHLIVRGVHSPLLGLVIDRFQAYGQTHTTANDPFLEGGRPATVIFP